MRFSETLFLAYFPVWAILAVGQLLFLRGRSPSEKKYWHPRLSLLNLIVIGGFMVAIVASSQQWLAVVATALMVVAIGLLLLTRVTICDQCGATVQPRSLLFAAKFCPKCGSPVSPARLSDPRP